MVKTRLIAFLLICVSFTCCSVPGKPEGASVGMVWEKFVMDGSRTGVTAYPGGEPAASFGTIENGIYRAPNGIAFADSVIVKVASDLLDAQPSVAYLKKSVAVSASEMTKKFPQSLLSNWAADVLREGVESVTGRKTDVSLINFGGIRQDMPAGAVLYDDIVSMFPFKNYLCWVQLKGKDLECLFSDMVKNRNLQAFSGAKLVVEKDRLISIEVGGEKVCPDKLYGMGTLDFLLDGGDRIYVAKNSVNLVMTDFQMKDWVLEYLKDLTSKGQCIESAIDDRITILGK